MTAPSLPTLPLAEATLARISGRSPLRLWGRVRAVSGNNIELEGLTAPVGAVCRIHLSGGDRLDARLIGFQQTHPLLAPLAFPEGVAAGDPVELIANRGSVAVGPALRGRVINALGEAIDGAPLPPGLRTVDLDQPAPESLSRPAISTPIQTGIRAVDGFLTCGRGQRVGIFAGSGVGKSTLLSMLVKGTAADTIVVAMVGERGREVREFIEHSLGDEGLRRSVLVVATSDQPAALRVQAAMTATAVAEQLRDEGQNVLLLVDSVTRFAMAQREIGLAAGEPPTTRGYPPSVFAMLPRLVERAGNTERGSITAFYSVLVEGDDTNEPIADTLRGLLDGHIVLSRKLASESHWPAIDILASLSRLQAKIVSRDALEAAQRIRLAMAEYERNVDLITIGAYKSGTNAELDRAVAIRPALLQLLRQATDQRTPLAKTQQQLLQLAASLTNASASPPATENPPPAGPTKS